jgi:hypothetical protein
MKKRKKIEMINYEATVTSMFKVMDDADLRIALSCRHAQLRALSMAGSMTISRRRTLLI